MYVFHLYISSNLSDFIKIANINTKFVSFNSLNYLCTSYENTTQKVCCMVVAFGFHTDDGTFHSSSSP